MINCQKNQIIVQDNMLKHKDYLLQETDELLKLKDDFANLQAAEIGLLRGSACFAKAPKPPAIPIKPNCLKSAPAQFPVQSNVPILANLLLDIKQGVTLNKVTAQQHNRRKRFNSTEEALRDQLKKLRTAASLSSSSGDGDLKDIWDDKENFGYDEVVN